MSYLNNAISAASKGTSGASLNGNTLNSAAAASKGSSSSGGESSKVSTLSEFFEKLWKRDFGTAPKRKLGDYSPKPPSIAVVKKQREDVSAENDECEAINQDSPGTITGALAAINNDSNLLDFHENAGHLAASVLDDTVFAGLDLANVHCPQAVASFVQSAGMDSFVYVSDPPPTLPLVSPISSSTEERRIGMGDETMMNLFVAEGGTLKAGGNDGDDISSNNRSSHSSSSLESYEQEEEASFSNHDPEGSDIEVVSDLDEHEEDDVSLVNPEENSEAKDSESDSLSGEEDDNDEAASDVDHEENANPDRNEGFPAVNEEGSNARLAVQDQAIARPPPMHSPSKDQRIDVAVDETTNEDILCGQQFAGSDHPGNVFYLQMIEANKARYLAFGNRHGEKTAIRNAIVQDLTDCGSRFIKVEGDRRFLLTLDEARRKTSQSLRENKDRKRAKNKKVTP